MIRIDLLAARHSRPSGSEDRVDEDPDKAPAGEAPGAILKKFLEGVVEGAEDFTRRRPMEGMLLSLLAGFIVSDLLRRNR